MRTLKHVVDIGSFAQSTTGRTGITLVEWEQTGTLDRVTNPEKVQEGSRVSRITLLVNLNLYNNTAPTTVHGMTLDWYVAWQGVNDADTDMPHPSTTGYHPLRGNVFMQDQDMIHNNSTTSGAMAAPYSRVYRYVIDIPPGYGTGSDGDRIRLFFARQTQWGTPNNADFLYWKFKAIFKEMET